jgi:hypothetical protein
VCGVEEKHTEASKGQEDNAGVDDHIHSTFLMKRQSAVSCRHGLDRAGDCHVSAGGRNRIDRARIFSICVGVVRPVAVGHRVRIGSGR